MQALVRKEMKKFLDLDLILMDGRKHSIYTIVEELRQLPENTVILVGTWRVDMNEGYFMRNATYAMMEVTPTIPTFTPSSVSLGHWAIGGVLPDYRKWVERWLWSLYGWIPPAGYGETSFGNRLQSGIG